MKNKIVLITILSLASSVSFSRTSTDAGAGPVAAAKPTIQFNSCRDAENLIPGHCSNSQAYLEWMSKEKSWLDRFKGMTSRSSGSQLEEGKSVIGSSLSKNTAMMTECTSAMQACTKVCNDTITQQSNNMSRDPNNAQTYKTRIDAAKSSQNACKVEFGKMRAGITASSMDLQKIMGTIMAALEIVKGLKGDGGGELSAASADPCDPANAGQYDHLLVNGECNKEAQPNEKGSRAALVGTGVGELGDDFGGDIQTASMGDPGGKRDGNKKNKGAAFTGAGAGGFGGFGAGGAAVGAGAGAKVASEKGLDTGDKGFFATDGAAGGSFGGGSGAPLPKSKFSGSSLGGATPQQVAFNKKVTEFKKSQISKRGLASSGGVSGPFKDNWSVIKEAYKNNSKTMFHQK